MAQTIPQTIHVTEGWRACHSRTRLCSISFVIHVLVGKRNSESKSPALSLNRPLLFRPEGESLARSNRDTPRRVFRLLEFGQRNGQNAFLEGSFRALFINFAER